MITISKDGIVLRRIEKGFLLSISDKPDVALALASAAINPSRCKIIQIDGTRATLWSKVPDTCEITI